MGQATNGLGWVVEQYLHESGWAAVTPPFLTEQEARDVLPSWQSQDAPARVYEALNHHQ